MEEILLEKSPLEEHSEELKNRFDVLTKNRSALCNEKGELKDPKYRKAYTKLLNEVGELTSKVAMDTTVKLYLIPNEKAVECLDSIIAEFNKMLPEFKRAIRYGSYEGLEEVMQKYRSNAFSAYLEAMSAPVK